MKFRLLTMTLIFFVSITSLGQNKVGVITMEDGKSITMYNSKSERPVRVMDYIIEGDMGLTAQKLIYFDSAGEMQQLKQKDIKEVQHGEQLYQNFKITKSGGNRLHEVIMQNDTYVLTSYYFLVNYFYVFRKEDMKMVKSKEKHSKKKKSDYASLEKILPKYFSDCEVILEQIRTNIKTSDYKILYGNVAVANNKMFAGIQNYKCN